jgi:hypothetical protein
VNLQISLEISEKQTASMFTAEDLHALLSPITLLNCIQHSVKTQRKTLFIVKVHGAQYTPQLGTLFTTTLLNI